MTTATMNNTTWRTFATCRTDPDRQYPNPTDWAAIAAAKAICDRCPVRAACLKQALTDGEEDGIWGGFTPAERARLAQGKPARRCQACQRWYVPGAADSKACHGCPNTHRPDRLERRAADLYERHGQTIRKLAAAGRTDPEIGHLLGVSSKEVCAARQIGDIPSGWLIQLQQRREDLTVRADLVDAVEQDRADHGLLRPAEMAELWRRWQASGGRATGFQKRYGTSWRTMRRTRELAGALALTAAA